MIEQLKKFCNSTKNEISKLETDIKGIENASVCDLDQIKNSLVYLKNDYNTRKYIFKNTFCWSLVRKLYFDNRGGEGKAENS